MAEEEWKGKSRLNRVCDVPIKALNVSARRLLGQYLNPQKLTLSPSSQLQQDWRGLAESIGVGYNYIQQLEGKTDQTFDLIEYWSQKQNATIGRLLQVIEKLDRYDVLEDEILQERILLDVELYKQNQLELKENTGLVEKPIQVPEVNSNITVVPFEGNGETEFKNITIGEVKTGKPEFFDAFVCYATEDQHFVDQLINVLEKQHGFKLCIKDRNVLPGSAQETVLLFLIRERCNKMIIVLSPNFLKCPECDFMVKFGHSLDSGGRTKKLIPIVIQECKKPDIISYITVVDYTKCGLAEWFWERICGSLTSCFTDTTTECGKQHDTEHSLLAAEDGKDIKSTKNIESTAVDEVVSTSAEKKPGFFKKLKLTKLK